MTKFHLEVVTPERQVFVRDVDLVSAPTPEGRVGILARHAPLFTLLEEGEIKIVDGQSEYFLAIGGGFMEVAHDKVIVLVSRAVHAEELNEAEIKRAYESAKEVITKKAKGPELAQAQAILRRSTLELKLLRRRRPRASSLPPTLQ